jgi:F-box-like
MIFKYLPVQDLVKCHRVSRRWCSVARCDPDLYKSIDLSVTAKPLTNRNVQALLRYADGKIHGLKMQLPDVTFANFVLHRQDPDFKHHGNMHLAPLFENLECLEQLGSTKNVGHPLWEIPGFPSSKLRRLSIASPQQGRFMVRLANLAVNLEYLEYTLSDPLSFDSGTWDFTFQSVTVLRLTLGARSPAFRHIVGSFPKLEELHFRSSDYDGRDEALLLPKKLKVLSLRGKLLAVIGFLPADLTFLGLYDLPALRFLFPILPEHPENLELFPVQSRLEELHISNVRNMTRKGLERTYTSAPTLRKLTVSSPQFKTRDIEYFLREGINLTYINISQVQYVNDATLKFIHRLIKVECLEIDHCPGVTGHGIIQLVQALSIKKGGRLKTIRAKGNESIRRQTVDWAWQLGVVVSI